MFTSIHDPFRPPDFRWKRAAWLRTQGKYTRHNRDDEHTILAKRYQALYEKAVTPLQLAYLAEKMPGIYYAHQVYRRDEQDDRWTVEARLLAGQTPQEVADRCGITAEVVFWFETLFFDVRHRLGHIDWIANRVLGPAAHRGIWEREYDLLLKLYGWLYGPQGVDSLVRMSTYSGARPTSPQEMAVAHRADYVDSMGRKAGIALRCTPLNPATQQWLMELYQKLLDLEQKRDDRKDAGSLIVENINMALKTLPFRVASAEQPPLRIQAGAVEMRGDQQMAGIMGLPAAVEPELVGFTFSEPETGDAPKAP
jgi:hypothetical protein